MAEMTAQDFFVAETIDADETLSGAELQKVLIRYRELEHQIQQQLSSQQSVSDALTETRAELFKARNTSTMLRKTIVDVALDAVITIDDSGRIIEFNTSAERIFGHARATVLGQPMAQVIIPPHLREPHQQGMQRYLSGKPVAHS